MTASRKRYLTAYAATAVLALGLYGCGGGGGDGTMPPPMPEDVDLSGVTAGFMAVAGMFTVTAGQSQDHGDIEFSCAVGGADCTVAVMVDASGDITATSIGGTVTAMNSAAYTARITPMAVDLARVTPGYMAEAGTVTVTAGQMAVHGDIEFSCVAGPYDCTVVVEVDANGEITATKTGGTVTAMNAPGYPYRHGLGASPLTSPTALSAADSLDVVASAGTAFAPVGAPVKYTTDDMGQRGVLVPEDDGTVYVESVTWDGQWGYTVVYVIDGQKTEVEFGQADHMGFFYSKEQGGTQYGFSGAPIFVGDRQLATHYYQLVVAEAGGEEAGGWRTTSAYGVLTPSGNLANLGSATYEGYIGGDVWNNFIGPDRDAVRGYIYGELTLEADFSASTISGDVDTIWIEPPDGAWVRLPDSNSIAISNGEIERSRFEAGWQGQDTDASSAPEASIRGFEGSMIGEFYGPNGEEVGGSFTGQREETELVVNGRFGAESQASAAARTAIQTAAGRDNGISVSPDPAVYADSSSDSLSDLLPDGNTAFAPISAVVQRNWGSEITKQPDAGAAFVKSISSDGANGYYVTYVVDGRETTAQFTEENWIPGYYEIHRYAMVHNYGLWTYTDSMHRDPNNRTGGSSEFTFFDMNGWVVTVGSDSFQGYSTYGARTRPENMPMGSGSYSGRMVGDVWEGDDPDHRTGVTGVYGDLTLDVDFDSSEISGLIDGLHARPNTAGEVYQPLREGNAFEISNGVIADGQFSADWVGVDTNTTPAEYSAAGFEGTMVGEFYGPAAEEVGGSIAGQAPAVGSDPALYLVGVFGAESQATIDARKAVQLAAGRDDGISVSQDPPVYADSSSDSLSDLLPDGNTAFAPTSAAVLLDFNTSESREPDTGAAFVKSISSDGANGFRVTFVVGGKETEVHFTAGSWSDVNGAFAGDPNNYWLWSITDSVTRDPSDRTSGSSEFDYFDIMGWIGVQVDNFQGISTFGSRTHRDNLPTGSATYTGWLRGDAQEGDDPHQTGGHRVRGDLTLIADFDSSAIAGQIDGIETLPSAQPYDDPWYQYAAGNTFDISNGVITYGRFEANWVGNDTNAGSGLGDSVRGFEGTMVGEFYGPNAEEVGGVLGGHRAAAGDLPAFYLHGGFGAKKQDDTQQ